MVGAKLLGELPHLADRNSKRVIVKNPVSRHAVASTFRGESLQR